MKQEDIKIGTPVTYWSIMYSDGRKENPMETEIRSDPWHLGHGEVVCKVKGKAGGVSIKHLDKRTP